MMQDHWCNHQLSSAAGAQKKAVLGLCSTLFLCSAVHSVPHQAQGSAWEGLPSISPGPLTGSAQTAGGWPNSSTQVSDILFAFHFYFKNFGGQPGWLSGLVPPSAQGVIQETGDRVPCLTPCIEPASPSACVVSASLSLSLSLSLSVTIINK